MVNTAHRAMMANAKQIYDGLSAEERTGLRKLRPSMMKEAVSAEIGRSLVAKKLAENKLGGSGLTELGKMVASLLPDGLY